MSRLRDHALEHARERTAYARELGGITFGDGEVPTTLKPLDFSQRTANELRPMTFGGMVGQRRIKLLMRRIVDTAKASGSPMDHMLLVGSAGTGKTTLAQVTAHELERPVYMLKAPIEQDTLEELARVCDDGDVLIVDECHLWAKPDRRAGNRAASPEQVYSILEDNRLQTATGVTSFPKVTWIGCTTDSGMLPEPLLARFPLQPHLDEYDVREMTELALDNAGALGVEADEPAATVLARACRSTPRIVNRYVRNAASLGGKLDRPFAVEIVTVLNSTTLDGLNSDMQGMLGFLLGQRRQDAKGNVRYQAGVNSIATALGHSRDTKAVALYVEPYLIRRGLVQVTHGGRALTDAGIARARRL